MVGMALQDAGREGHGHAELLLNGQVQVPDGPERQKQDQNIGQDIDGASDDEVEVRIDAGAWDRRVPCFGHGPALEDDRQHVGQVEADVQPDEDLDEPENQAALGGHEDAHELKEDCELRSQDCRRVEDSVDVNQLG